MFFHGRFVVLVIFCAIVKAVEIDLECVLVDVLNVLNIIEKM